MRHTIKVTYEVKARKIKQAAEEIVYGQSIGNPYVRTPFDKGLKKHLPEYEVRGRFITVWYPLANVDFDGHNININHFMSMIMGGQMDIDNIRACKLVDIDWGKAAGYFPGPRYGIKGIRRWLGVYGRPLIGAIVKPKIGIGPAQHADIVEQLIDGGADFIKEDEILASQAFCPIEDRLKAVAEVLKRSRPVIYAACITADGYEIRRRYNLCYKDQIPAAHLNVWTGLGAYADLRNSQIEGPNRWPAIFFQKSGDKVWTTGKNSIQFSALCSLVNMIGCDFMHVGMYGGYMADTPTELHKRIVALKNTIPSFSCGATPEIARDIKTKFGNDVMIAAGGYVAGHPKGVGYAVREFREAIA